MDQNSGWHIYDINSISYSRCMSVQPWLNALLYKMNGPIHSSFKICNIGCTSVHQLYRIRIITKRIDAVNGIFLTWILIRKASVQTYRHSSQLSHNTSVQTVWNWLYVCTKTVLDTNGSQMDQISGKDIDDINSNSYSRCTVVQPWLHALQYRKNGPIHS